MVSIKGLQLFLQNTQKIKLINLLLKKSKEKSFFFLEDFLICKCQLQTLSKQLRVITKRIMLARFQNPQGLKI